MSYRVYIENINDPFILLHIERNNIKNEITSLDLDLGVIEVSYGCKTVSFSGLKVLETSKLIDCNLILILIVGHSSFINP